MPTDATGNYFNNGSGDDDGDGGTGSGFAEDDLDFLHDLHANPGDPYVGPREGLDVGQGLTAPERELADELERQRGLERTRDRYERFARERGVGVGGGTGSDADALAVIDAAARFGTDAVADDSDEALAERHAISEALLTHSRAEAAPPGEYHFYATVQKQSTNNSGNLLLSLEVPWEFRAEVFKALEDMPFSCFVRMTGVE